MGTRLIARSIPAVELKRDLAYDARVRTALLLLLPALLGACTTKKMVYLCDKTDPVTGECTGASEAGGDTTGNIGFVPPDGVTAAEDPGGTTAGEDAQLDETTTAAEDAGKPGGKCAQKGDLKIGMPCESDTQCETCLCYGEAYMAPFRFCTKDCSSGSGSDCPLGTGEFPEYACLKFTAKQVNEYGLEHGGICMPRCENAAECKIYAPDYDLCPQFQTDWQGATVQAARTCQIQSAVE